MNDTTQRTLLDLLPAYALGALDADEARFVEEHLADYPACVAELTALRDDLALLAFSAPAATPPPTAKEDLFARIDREGHAARPATVTPLAPATMGRGRFDWRGSRVALAALAAVLIVGLLGWAAIAQYRLNAERQRLAAVAQQNDQLTAQVSQLAFVDKLLHDPNAAHPVSGPPVAEYGGLPAAGYVYIDPTSTIGLMLTYWLPTIAPDQRFQVWLVTPDGARDSGGLFSADAKGNAHVIINAPAPFATYKSIGVTIEPAGGSSGPTTPRVCGGEIR